MTAPSAQLAGRAGTAGVHLLVVCRTAIEPAYTAAIEAAGFVPAFAGSLGEAVRMAVARPPEAVLALADAAAAGDLCEVLRALGPHPLVIAAPDLPPDAAAACLDQGADAVITMLVPAAELAVRLRAAWLRAADQASRVTHRRIGVRDVVIDLGARTVHRRGEPIDLSPTEFHVLALLAERPGQVVTNRELLTRVWGEECADDVHYVRLYIGYLRAKLEDDPRRPRLILTQWGVGYRLAAEEAATAWPAVP